MKPIPNAQLIETDLPVRRWKHLEKDPTKKGMNYIHALVEQIRVRVLAKEIA